MDDFTQEPTFQAPLLYQLYHALRGTQAPRWSATDYAMGLGTGPLRGPRINVPLDLQRLLQQGPKMNQPATPQWTGLERPWSGIYKGNLNEGRTVPSPSWKNPTTYDLTDVAEEVMPSGAQVMERSQLSDLLRSMGPKVDLNAEPFLRNAEFLQRFMGD